ncbi:substrate-binding periplasmic protein [Aliikangiella coralliicola]|uniref:Amino acid ABC transporter substrate-binding protein n=1 Tax=Aliikangiella coralliicola TaxID=2592383 RepID=A0A545U8R5_9GAMM|nr:transporter substrate-binding domain-containing protein [Aliikangiella coralliicola]TQV85856.1 amino acid ABC transporter substrate-binding protein [Aliikangiella coralliicola]
MRLSFGNRKLLVVSFVLLISNMAFANSQKIKIVTEHFPPLQIKNEDSLSGFSIDVINELLSTTEVKAEIDVLPWARAIKIADTRKNTMIFSITRTPEREHKYQWIGALEIDTKQCFWSLKSRRDIVITGWADVKDLRTAIAREDSQINRLNQNGFIESKNLYLTNDLAQSLQMLMQGRVEFLLAGELFISYYIKKLGLPKSKLKRYCFRNDGYYPLSIAFNKNTSQDTIELFKKSLQEMKESGALKKIYSKWMMFDGEVGK